MVDQVMTVTEVAEYLRLNPQTIYRKAKAGELPVFRIGRAIRFRKSELETWLKNLSHSIPEEGADTLEGTTRHVTSAPTLEPEKTFTSGFLPS